jgi:glycosyltransferase involved in cell wall biosynthesis
VQTPPKVCHVISGYFRNDARVFYRQCLSLKKQGFDVCILTNDAEPSAIQEGIEVISCAHLPVPRWKALLFSTRHFFQPAIDINADVYQIHSPELLPLAVKLKRLGKIVVYDAHEDMPAHILEKDWLPKWSRRIVSRCFRIYLTRTFRMMDEIISPHIHVIRDISKRFEKGILIANFPILKKDNISTESEFTSRRNIFCYSGTVYSYSNQETVADAMLSTNDAQYHIAGYIDADHKNRLSKSGAGSRIKFLGRLNQSDLTQFYHSSIAGIVIYDYKLNLGDRLGSYGTNKIFEYMEAGLPIICTDYELWQDIVNRHQCGYCVKPGDTEALRDAMHSIMTDKKLAFKMGQNGRRAVEDEFNWKFEEVKYCDLFRKLTLLEHENILDKQSN